MYCVLKFFEKYFSLLFRFIYIRSMLMKCILPSVSFNGDAYYILVYIFYYYIFEFLVY